MNASALDLRDSRRDILRVALMLRGPLHVGAGSSLVADNALLRSASGTPRIAGRAVAGVLRSMAETAAPTLLQPSDDHPFASTPEDVVDLLLGPDPGRSSHRVEAGRASLLAVGGAKPRIAGARSEIRPSAPIARATGTSTNLYEVEYWPSGLILDSRFVLHEYRDTRATALARGALATLLLLWQERTFAIGGNSGRGAGWCVLGAVRHLRLDLTDAEIRRWFLLRETPYIDETPEAELAALTPEALLHWREEAGFAPPLLPATPLRRLDRATLRFALEPVDAVLVGAGPGQQELPAIVGPPRPEKAALADDELSVDPARPATEADTQPFAALRTHGDGTLESIFVLPGSSLRGVIRSRSEQIVRALGRPACDPSPGSSVESESKDPALLIARCDPPRPEDERLRIDWALAGELLEVECDCCRLFGSGATGSALAFLDATAVREAVVEYRDHVSIDGFSGGVAARAKFADAPILDCSFDGEIFLDRYEPWKLSLLLHALRDVHDGLARVGRTRGYGRMRLTRLEVEFSGVPGASAFDGLETDGGLLSKRALDGAELLLDETVEPSGELAEILAAYSRFSSSTVAVRA